MMANGMNPSWKSDTRSVTWQDTLTVERKPADIGKESVGVGEVLLEVTHLDNQKVTSNWLQYTGVLPFLKSPNHPARAKSTRKARVWESCCVIDRFDSRGGRQIGSCTNCSDSHTTRAQGLLINKHWLPVIGNTQQEVHKLRNDKNTYWWWCCRRLRPNQPDACIKDGGVVDPDGMYSRTNGMHSQIIKGKSPRTNRSIIEAIGLQYERAMCFFSKTC